MKCHSLASGEFGNLSLRDGHDSLSIISSLWKVNNDTCADQVYNAIKVGYRCFDGACGKSSVSLLVHCYIS